jgi:hypothetical protein
MATLNIWQPKYLADLLEAARSIVARFLEFWDSSRVGAGMERFVGLQCKERWRHYPMPEVLDCFGTEKKGFYLFLSWVHRDFYIFRLLKHASK